MSLTCVLAPILLSSFTVHTMNQVKFSYSTKNIPCPTKVSYEQRLIEKTGIFLKNLRWRAFFFLNPKATTEGIKTYGFNTRKSPPSIPEMNLFENRLLDIIQSVEFTKPPNAFQQKVKQDLNKLKQDNRLVIKADKTNNYYKLNKEEYQQLVNKNVQQEYKKSSESNVDRITAEA